MKDCKSVKEVIQGMEREYQDRIQREFENILTSVKMNHADRAKESTELIDRYREKIALLERVICQLEEEVNIE